MADQDIRLYLTPSGRVIVVVMVQALIIAGWVAVGAAVGFYEVRRGHWRWLWLLGAIAGPLAIPLAWQANRDEPSVTASILSDAEGADRSGLRVLVGIDGSEDSTEAAASIARTLSSHLGSLTLATVVDYESMVDYAGLDREADRDRAQAQAQANAGLTAVADDVEPLVGCRPGMVILAGKPATALQEHASDEHFDLVVIGRRGRGLTKRLVGSCATELTRASSVPVVLMPTGEGSHGSPAGREALAGS